MVKGFSAFLLVSMLSISMLVPALSLAQPADGDGASTIVGKFDTANADVTPSVLGQIAVALVDSSNIITNSSENWIPVDGQILGFMTTPVFPLPGEYQINLPVSPSASSLDVDNDGDQDAGVQVFHLTVGTDLINDSYLQQFEQIDGLTLGTARTSVLLDIATGTVLEGDLLVFSPDDQQAFPSSAGNDNLWFTEDDQVESLESGYTVVRLQPDGSATRDRSVEARMDTRENPEDISPDFSEMGILESYHALIDHLAVRYSYTQLRGLEWEDIRASYLPEVQAADAAEDLAGYYLTLGQLASSIRDAHVLVYPGPDVDFLRVAELSSAVTSQFEANVGAYAVAVSDPDDLEGGPTTSVEVVTVGEGTPAEEVGWVPGTEILTVDGVTPAEKMRTVPTLFPVGTDEAALKQQAPFVLNFQEGHEAIIEYRLPGSETLESVSLIAGFYDTGSIGGGFGFDSSGPFAINLSEVGGYSVIQFGDFVEEAGGKIAAFELALATHTDLATGGIILDLRVNGGGTLELYQTLASYFYNSDSPLPVSLFDWWLYRENAGDFVRYLPTEYLLTSPRPELVYDGPLVVLVDSLCASACEYFSQTLQETGRATVIGQYASVGAGGPTNSVVLPGGTVFQYTYGRTTFSGTDEPNIEAKGVVPDVRVPVTVDTERAKELGEDPVLDAAIAYLDQVNEDLAATPVSDGS